jgi:altronate hydrolase
MKVATNSQMYARLSEDMDIDAGVILSEGRTVEEVGREIYAMWLRMASGERTKSEAQGLGDYEFVPWQIGAVM